MLDFDFFIQCFSSLLLFKLNFNYYFRLIYLIKIIMNNKSTKLQRSRAPSKTFRFICLNLHELTKKLANYFKYFAIKAFFGIFLLFSSWIFFGKQIFIVCWRNCVDSEHLVKIVKNIRQIIISIWFWVVFTDLKRLVLIEAVNIVS